MSTSGAARGVAQGRLTSRLDTRRMLDLGRPYRWRTTAGVLLAVASTAFLLAVPLGLRALVDTVFTRRDAGDLNRLAGALFILFAVQAIVSFGGRFLLESTGERIVADLRELIYAHVHDLPLRFFDNGQIGNLTSRLTSDVDAVRTALTSAIAQVMTVAASLVGSAALMLAINWRLGLVILCVAPAGVATTRYFGARLRGVSRQVQDRLGEATSVAEEALAAMRLVMAFARKDYETRRYTVVVEALFEAARRKALVGALFATVVTSITLASVVAVFWYGGLEVIAGRLSSGDLIALLFYALNVAGGVRNLAGVFGLFSAAAGASERVFEILDVRPEIFDPPAALELPAARGEVRFEGVGFGYEPGVPVLHDVTLAVRPGETVALVGPSGAGKSTLLSLVPRFYDPDLGRVLIDGYDLRTLSVRSLRRHVAVVSQDVQLFNISVRENVRYGRLDASDSDVERAVDAANAHEFVAALPRGYDTIVGERGVKLSGGQRQRIAIARALLRNARILLLDEATSSLDAESEALVKQAIDRLIADRTALIIAHRLATVRDADRIVVLEHGRIAEEGTHSGLVLRQGLYARLAARQFLTELDADAQPVNNLRRHEWAEAAAR